MVSSTKDALFLKRRNSQFISLSGMLLLALNTIAIISKLRVADVSESFCVYDLNILLITFRTLRKELPEIQM